VHPLYTEYLSIVDAELDAESLALDITHGLHDDFYIGGDGASVHSPSLIDLDRENAAWAAVTALRARRQRWILDHS
jgi:hypothetical protein